MWKDIRNWLAQCRHPDQEAHFQILRTSGEEDQTYRFLEALDRIEEALRGNTGSKPPSAS
jgi:hypothetical protein